MGGRRKRDKKGPETQTIATFVNRQNERVTLTSQVVKRPHYDIKWKITPISPDKCTDSRPLTIDDLLVVGALTPSIQKILGYIIRQARNSREIRLTIISNVRFGEYIGIPESRVRSALRRMTDLRIILPVEDINVKHRVYDVSPWILWSGRLGELNALQDNLAEILRWTPSDAVWNELWTASDGVEASRMRMPQE